MPSLPSFPTQSLYTGTLPAFPTTNYSWGFSFFGHWEGFSIAIPNVSAIPMWIAQIVTYGVLWAFGWLGAIYEYAVKFITIEVQNLATDGISFAFGTYDKILSTVERIAGHTGILSPLLTILIISGLSLGTLYVLIVAFNAVRGVA